GTGGVEEPVVVRVEIVPNAVTLVELDGGSLSATAFDAADQPIPSLPITWQSSHPSTVTVATDGSIFANRAGAATITATIDGVSGEAEVVVTPGVVAGVVVTGVPSELPVGDVIVASAVAMDSRDRALPGRTATWSSSDPAVATVATGGIVMAVSPGTATITAEIEGIEGTAQVEVVSPASKGMAMGGEHTCYLDGSGEVWCWGNNDLGQLGIGSTGAAEYTPVRAAPGMFFKSIAAGEHHTCGVDLNSQVYCWGSNGDLQLGLVGVSGSPTPNLVSQDPFGFVGAQYRGVCAANPQGHPYCWGFNSGDHELGHPSTSKSEVPLEVSAPAGEPLLEVVELQGGWYNTCALTTDSRLYCWGYNGFGQLGNGSTASSALPVEVFPGSTVEAYSVGEHFGCAIAGGTTYCWGRSVSGNLGTSSSANVPSPTPIPAGGLNFVAIACGEGHACALDDVGQAWCWGSNGSGQLGRPGGDSLTPVQVDGGLTFASIHASKSQTCAVATDGSLWCWGSNWNGRLGIGPSFAQVDTPTAVQW
ncbi:MAG TPA: Ig-like domain-containing protein, partial [Vulgatibacter sp.]